MIIVDQLPKILGIHFTKGSFLHNVQAIVRGARGMCRWPPLVVGVLTIVGLAAIEKFRPRWPAPLIVVARCNCRRRLARLAAQWRGTGRHDSRRDCPLSACPIWLSRMQLWPARARHRAHELHGNRSGRPRVRAQR